MSAFGYGNGTYMPRAMQQGQQSMAISQVVPQYQAPQNWLPQSPVNWNPTATKAWEGNSYDVGNQNGAYKYPGAPNDSMEQIYGTRGGLAAQPGANEYQAAAANQFKGWDNPIMNNLNPYFGSPDAGKVVPNGTPGAQHQSMEVNGGDLGIDYMPVLNQETLFSSIKNLSQDQLAKMSSQYSGLNRDFQKTALDYKNAYTNKAYDAGAKYSEYETSNWLQAAYNTLNENLRKNAML